jgi:hypothetical protein
VDRACDSALTMHEKRKLNRWKEPPWTARRAPGTGRSARAALALGRQSPASRCRAPDVSLRPPAVTAKAAPAGPRTCRPRAQDEGRAVAAARREQAPGSGQGRAISPAWRVRMGWGWETNAMRCECKGSDTGRQLPFPNGKLRLATLENLYLQPASSAGRFISRCSSAPLHSAAGPLRGHRPAKAPSALHHLNCRASFDTWRHAGSTLSSSFKGATCGLPR